MSSLEQQPKRNGGRKAKELGLPEDFDREAYNDEDGFGMVYVRVLLHLGLSANGMATYVAAATMATRAEDNPLKDGCFRARKKTFAARARIGVTSLDRGIAELKAKGLLTQERRWDGGSEVASDWRLYDRPGQLLDVAAAEEGVTPARGGGHPRTKGGSPQDGVGVTPSLPEGHPETGHLEQTTVTDHGGQTTSSDHVNETSLAPAARTRNETAPQRPKGKVDREALRLALDTMAEHPDYNWRPAWDKYLEGVERQGFTIQPRYVVELQAIFAVILTERDALTLDACVDRVLTAKQPYLTTAVAKFAVSRVFSTGPGPVSDEDVDYWTRQQFESLLAWSPTQTASEVEVPLPRGLSTVSNDDEKPMPTNAMAAMRERILGKPVAPRPKTEEDLEAERIAQEQADWERTWQAMSPAEQDAHRARMKQLAGLR